MYFWYFNIEDIRKSNGSSFQNQPHIDGFVIKLILYKSLFKKAGGHCNWVKLYLAYEDHIINVYGQYEVFVDPHFSVVLNCLLESTFLTEISKLSHFLIVERVKESVVRDNLQQDMIILVSLPLLNGYTVVLLCCRGNQSTR